MTPLGTIIFNDGVEKASIDNARNLLDNGVSFDLVRKSIQNLSDETLEKIYKEVMESKKQQKSV